MEKQKSNKKTVAIPAILFYELVEYFGQHNYAERNNPNMRNVRLGNSLTQVYNDNIYRADFTGFKAYRNEIDKLCEQDAINQKQYYAEKNAGKDDLR